MYGTVKAAQEPARFLAQFVDYFTKLMLIVNAVLVVVSLLLTDMLITDRWRLLQYLLK